MSKLTRDLMGEKFGKLTVIKRVEPNGKNISGNVHWLCKCECGNVKIESGSRLKNVKSLNVCSKCATKIGSNKIKTHGMTNSKEYRAWRSMINRCFREENSNYYNYGGRGILVCERWVESFENFFSDMGYTKHGLSLDRINNNGNYEPSNCRWVDAKTQQNNKSNNRLIKYNGEVKTLSEWCNDLGLSSNMVQARVDRYGWTIKQAFENKKHSQVNERQLQHNNKTGIAGVWYNKKTGKFQVSVKKKYYGSFEKLEDAVIEREKH